MFHISIKRECPQNAPVVPNVRDHRWVAVARPMAGSDSDQASGVPLVAIR